MAGIIGIGGIFFRSKDPKALAAWYREMLGMAVEDWGGAVFPAGGPNQAVWSPFAADSKYMEPSPREFMINLVTDDIDGVVARLEEKGVAILGRDDSDPHGRFAWFLDPDGTKIELWEGK